MFLLAVVAAPGTGHAQEETAHSVWDGVFTAAQADRGDELYAKTCATCHGADMRGGAGLPGLVGPEWLFLWNGQTAGSFFRQVQATMPLDEPGGLRNQQYVDILAAIFRANDFPASQSQELPLDADALDEILITRTNPNSQ